MNVRATCPKCEKPLSIRPALAGKKVRCPKCRHMFSVAIGDVPATTTAEKSKTAADEPALSDFVVTLRCIRTFASGNFFMNETTIQYRHSQIMVQAPETGSREQEVTCPNCGRNLKLTIWSASDTASFNLGICVTVIAVSIFFGQAFYYGNFPIGVSGPGFRNIGIGFLFILPILSALCTLFAFIRRRPSVSCPSDESRYHEIM